MSKINLKVNDETIVPIYQNSKPIMTDLQQFMDQYQPWKFKELKNGIEVRGVYDLNGAMNKARDLIIDLALGLEVVHNADMAAYRAFEVREVVS